MAANRLIQMSGRHLLDTNVIVALFRGDKNVQTEMSKSPEIFIPVIAIGELLYGAHHSSDVSRHQSQVGKFANSSTVLNCDSQTAEKYGQIKHALKLAGHPIPENDIWIAAIAQQFNLTVVTRDKHFDAVTGIVTVEW